MSTLFLEGYMSKIYCSWKDEEIKQLFAFIEEGKENNKSLIRIFSEFAELSGRKANSVRNYYYAELAELEKNCEKRERLKIDLTKHFKLRQVPFCESDEKSLVKYILEQSAKGVSVRRACLQLSNNNLSDMIRFQNKYRNLIKSKPKLFEECAEELKRVGVNVCVESKKQSSNILYMPKQKTLSDKDIESLFMGLVRLVKRVANEQANQQAQSQIKLINDNLKTALVNIKSKENEIEKLSSNLRVLQNENSNLTEKIRELRTEMADGLQSSMKIEKLKKFTSNLTKSEKSKNAVKNF